MTGTTTSAYITWRFNSLTLGFFFFLVNTVSSTQFKPPFQSKGKKSKPFHFGLSIATALDFVKVQLHEFLCLVADLKSACIRLSELNITWVIANLDD
jgi:hypothetical protein